MSGFVIFFQEKEGSTALVEQLGLMPGISIVRADNRKREPFDRHTCGKISVSALMDCLEGIFGSPPAAPETISPIYNKSSGRSLSYDPRAKAIGFKMRFNPDRDYGVFIGLLSRVKILSRIMAGIKKFFFEKMLFGVFARHNVTVFVLIRRDILRWSLSAYHGDGTGNVGHLQFKLASGEIERSNIEKIWVDPERLSRIVRRRKRMYRKKHRLICRLGQAGIRVFPIFYEDFTQDRVSFFKEFFSNLEVPINENEIIAALKNETVFQKVHSDDISTFVINHEEIMARFGGLTSPWSTHIANQRS